MTDPIADMLTRIRNAQMAHKAEVMIPFSKIKMKIAEILEREGYIKSVSKTDENLAEFRIELSYKGDKSPLIKSLKRVSKGGRRIYSGKETLPNVLNGLGFAIVTTSKGVMTNREARQAGVGGEIICEIY